MLLVLNETQFTVIYRRYSADRIGIYEAIVAPMQRYDHHQNCTTSCIRRTTQELFGGFVVIGLGSVSGRPDKRPPDRPWNLL